MHECLGLYVFCDKTVLFSKFTRKQKTTDPRLSKSYRLYGIKQVWTAQNYTHQYPGQQGLRCHLRFHWQCCSSLSMVISSVAVLVSDPVSAAVCGLELTSGLRIDMSLHGIDNSFHHGGNVWSFVRFSFLLCLVKKDLLISFKCFPFFPDLCIISIILIVD